MALLSSRALPIRSYSYRKPFSRLRFQDLRHLSQDLHDQSRVSVRQGTDSVEIKWNQGKDDTTSSFWGKYHHIWLRDNCQCPECYHPDTHQRLVDVLKISADLRPKSVGLGTGESVGTAKPSPQTLAVEWEDGHRSAFPLSWLQSHAYEWQGEKPQSETLAKGVVCRPTVWGKEISEAPPMVDYESFMKDDQTFLEWSDKVDRYGFCFIDGIPLETQYSKQVLERAGVLRHTFYGDFWDFEANSKADDDLDMGDTAYTALAIDSHTDGNYLHEAPGLQMLHVVHFKGTGGESILVDGFKLAEVIQEENPDHYHILSTVPLEFHYTDKNNKYMSTFVPFTVDQENGKLSEVHFNNYDRLPLGATTMQALRKTKPNGSITDIYEAIQTFTRTMRDKNLHCKFRLEPGRAVIFDNHRVLHARTSFTMRRRMCGGYVNREDWRSKVMVARLKK